MAFHEGPGIRRPFSTSRRDIGGLSAGSVDTLGVIGKEKGQDNGWLVEERGVCACVQAAERPESKFQLRHAMSPGE